MIPFEIVYMVLLIRRALQFMTSSWAPCSMNTICRGPREVRDVLCFSCMYLFIFCFFIYVKPDSIVQIPFENDCSVVTSIIRLYQLFEIVSLYMYVKYLYLCQEKINKL